MNVVTAKDPELQPFADKLGKALDRLAEKDPSYMEHVQVKCVEVVQNMLLWGYHAEKEEA
jgi:hypothetical protein